MAADALSQAEFQELKEWIEAINPSGPLRFEALSNASSQYI